MNANAADSAASNECGQLEVCEIAVTTQLKNQDVAQISRPRCSPHTLFLPDVLWWWRLSLGSQARVRVMNSYPSLSSCSGIAGT